MLTLISGGSGSGKSAFAENLIMLRSTTNRFYIATMIPFDAECKKRILRHRKMREDKHFVTIEMPLHIKNIEFPINNSKEELKPESNSVLLECMSNLVANELYEQEGAHENSVEEIIQGILHLKNQCKELIIVTNEVFSDGNLYDDEMHYLKMLGEINAQLATIADEVIEVVYSIPVYIKRNRDIRNT